MEISNEKIIKEIFESRAEVVEGHDPWRYGRDVAEATDKVEIDWICRKLPLSPGKRLFDIGCGTGRHSLEIARNNDSLKVIGCDFVEKNIDFANSEKKRLGIDNVSFYCSSATNFSDDAPFSKCDIIIAIGLIQYLTSENELFDFVNCCSEMMNDDGLLLLKHPLSYEDTFVLDYHRDEMDTRYISSYYGMKDIMRAFKEKFELMSIARTFTKKNVGDLLKSIERDERAKQMWILFQKKRKTV